MSLSKFKDAVKNFPTEMYSASKECKARGLDDLQRILMKHRKKYYDQFKLYSAGDISVVPEFMKNIHDGYLEQQKALGIMAEIDSKKGENR